jgi:hypothetical protein
MTLLGVEEECSGRLSDTAHLLLVLPVAVWQTLQTHHSHDLHKMMHAGNQCSAVSQLLWMVVCVIPAVSLSRHMPLHQLNFR